MAKPNAARGERVIYLGGYVDEAIISERGLQAHNAAGSNRMARISQALASVGLRPVLLSPATSLRAGRRGQLVYSQRIHHVGHTPVIFAAMVNIPGLNIATTMFMQLIALRGILRKGNMTAAVVYNYNISLVILSAYLKYVWRIPLVHNVEDIAEPRILDWLPGRRARPVQQLVYWICQHAIARMACSYVVPTRRFLNHLPQKSSVAVVTGCITIERATPLPASLPLRVLFAGKIEREHGVHTLVEALKLLDARSPVPALSVDITGLGDMADWVRQELSDLTSITSSYHGFVSGSKYRELLSAAHVCIAQQDPKGRHASFKTPSKVYEFLGYGKAVIATDVGDIGELNGDVLIAMPVLDATALANVLDELASDLDKTELLRSRARAHAKANFSYLAVGRSLHELIQKKEQSGPP